METGQKENAQINHYRRKKIKIIKVPGQAFQGEQHQQGGKYTQKIPSRKADEKEAQNLVANLSYKNPFGNEEFLGSKQKESVK